MLLVLGPGFELRVGTEGAPVVVVLAHPPVVLLQGRLGLVFVAAADAQPLLLAVVLPVGQVRGLLPVNCVDRKKIDQVFW